MEKVQVKLYAIKQKFFILKHRKSQEIENKRSLVDFVDNDVQQASKQFLGFHIRFQTDLGPYFCMKQIKDPLPVNLFLDVDTFQLLSYNINQNSMQKIKGKQQWTQDQKKMLAQLFPKFSSKKWKMISMEMAQKGYKRTQLECREKWINFLDPTLNNEDWSSQQLERLYNFHDKYGTRWCFMQKELNRTQNRIKNRFYGTIRNYIRLVMNTLCQRQTCFNTQINKISPSLLNDLYNSENIFDFLRGQIKKMIYRMKFKIDKKLLRDRIRNKQLLYRELLGLISSLFKGSFSLKFYEIVAYSDCDQDEEENSVKVVAKQLFPNNKKQVTKIIKKEAKENPQRDEDQISQQVSNDSESKKLTFKLQDKTSKNIEQNIQQIEQYQHLNAAQYMRKHNEDSEEKKPTNDPQLFLKKEMNSIYAFFDQSSLTYPQQQWMMHHAYRQTIQQRIAYELVIDKIRQQNLLLMQQQQDQLLSQLTNNVNIHGINSPMQNIRDYRN